jgi:hypothetical protein
MKIYPKYPTSIAALAFSPDGRRLAIACSYEHDNALADGTPEEQSKVLLLIKETVMDDCKVSSRVYTCLDSEPEPSMSRVQLTGSPNRRRRVCTSA